MRKNRKKISKKRQIKKEFFSQKKDLNLAQENQIKDEKSTKIIEDPLLNFNETKQLMLMISLIDIIIFNISCKIESLIDILSKFMLI